MTDNALSPEAFGLLLARIEKIESKLLGINVYGEVLDSLNKKIDELEMKIHMVRTVVSRGNYQQRPHKCPVCEGMQRDYFDVLYPYSEYPPDTKLDHEGRRYKDCRVCEGKGILWG